jgi:hypothetical protein
MTNPPIGAQLAREIATTGLYHAATQYVRVGEQIASGDSTQEMLRARQMALADAALIYAAAHGWTPAGEGGDGAPAA